MLPASATWALGTTIKHVLSVFLPTSGVLMQDIGKSILVLPYIHDDSPVFIGDILVLPHEEPVILES